MIEIEGLDYIAMARRKKIMPKPWVFDHDSRRSGKPCSKCGKATSMGTAINVPAEARERWTGKQYMRFCGPDCEKRGGW